MTHFFRWGLVYITTMVAIAVFFSTGFYKFVLERDITYLTFIIMAMYMWASTWLGLRFYRWIRYRTAFDLDNYHFISDLFFRLGLMGTLIGFIYMFMDLSSIDLKTQAGIQQMIAQMSQGLSTKVFSSLAGLVAGVLLSIQIRLVEHQNNGF